MVLDMKIRREKLGYSQGKIGVMLELSTATVSNIESGINRYHEGRYRALLDSLEQDRLEELVRSWPRRAAVTLGELAAAR